MDYYSVRTANLRQELKMEVYRVVPLPKGMTAAPTLRVVTATCGSRTVKTGTPVAVVEKTLTGRLLHVRVPIDEPVFPAIRLVELAKEGVTIELEAIP
jgi:hypothetical protein